MLYILLVLSLFTIQLSGKEILSVIKEVYLTDGTLFHLFTQCQVTVNASGFLLDNM